MDVREKKWIKVSKDDSTGVLFVGTAGYSLLRVHKGTEVLEHPINYQLHKDHAAALSL
jgi:hypothetical protein